MLNIVPVVQQGAHSWICGNKLGTFPYWVNGNRLIQAFSFLSYTKKSVLKKTGTTCVIIVQTNTHLYDQK